MLLGEKYYLRILVSIDVKLDCIANSSYFGWNNEDPVAVNLTIDIDTMESRRGERLNEGERGRSSSIMSCLVTFYQFNRLIQ